MDEKGKEEKENGEDIEGCAYDPEDGLTFEWAGRAEGMSFDED